MKKLSILIIIGILSLASCDLDEKVYSELSTSNYFQTENDLYAAVVGIYSYLFEDRQHNFAPGGNYSLGFLMGMVCDEFFMIEADGGTNVSNSAGAMRYFLMDAENSSYLYVLYYHLYSCIGDANLVIENIPNADVSDEIKANYDGEARAIRALCYYELWSLWGNVCIVTTADADATTKPEQSTEDEVSEWIAEELLTAIDELPNENYIGTSDYGRINRVGAQAILAKLYLNTKQWQNCADLCDTIISNTNVGLADDYQSIFSVDNDAEDIAKEMLVLLPCVASSGYGNIWLAEVLPSDFADFPNCWGVYRGYISFYDEFDSCDVRKDRMILGSYLNTDGDSTDIDSDRFIAQKYEIDESAPNVSNAGNDVPIIRMADIYLARAEALNELNGPNQTSINLINAVRNRAFPNNPEKLCNLSAFADKDTLNSYILQERHLELWAEQGIRREDLIRQGKFISFARKNIAAHLSDEASNNPQDYMTLFPFYQDELDANPNMEQNPGY